MLLFSTIIRIEQFVKISIQWCLCFHGYHRVKIEQNQTICEISKNIIFIPICDEVNLSCRTVIIYQIYEGALKVCREGAKILGLISQR